MKYRSTRGGVTGASFEDVVMGGLAPDRGLYVPENIPKLSKDEIDGLKLLPFDELAHNIMRRYIPEESIPSSDLSDLLKKSTKNFRSKDVTPVQKVGDTWVMELFHGPTFAFKDVALQFLGNLFEYFLQRRRSQRKNQARLTILGATSGDTGSAAIYGLRGKENIQCFILFPTGRVSEIQERQMTTVTDENIHCISMDGTFDDCQAIVKRAFDDNTFRDRVSLGAVNSINWARVLAQMTYYFWAFFRVKSASGVNGEECPIHCSVPTGNFGDVLAGYYARCMGIPLGHLLVATNENDILHRFITSGKYWKTEVISTISPSMDITVSSNFERYLFHLCGNDPSTLRQWMENFEKTGKLTVEGGLLSTVKSDFLSSRVTMKENLENIKKQWETNSYLFCPHSSIGSAGANQHHPSVLPPDRTVVLATAHAAKFPDAIKEVVNPIPVAPEQLEALWSLPTRKVRLHNDLVAVQDHILSVLRDDKEFN